MYALLFRLVFRRMDPELAHRLAFGLIRAVAAVPVLSGLLRRWCAPPGPSVLVLGRRVPGRLGLAAGFDKDAVGVPGMTMLGFGFVEVGTVTPAGQPGNEAPRLWRVVDQQALRNRMGFNNAGAAAMAERLHRLRSTSAGRRYVVGVNIGKNRTTPADRAAQDYAASARLLAPWADYLVVNVSSPNTPGLRDLQSVDSLRPLLAATRSAADEATGPGAVPLLVKIAPDLVDEDVIAVADLVTELDLAGVVAVNTTIAHDLGQGGLSGPPLLPRGLEVVRLLRGRLGAGRTIIGVGGISDADDVRAYLAAGADLVQGYTGLIYRGPFWAARIHRELAEGER
ncbi:quinone-dependent dihydroorotate dehydrogenase [Isoptericola sp. b490]|uniref:quinone-dependent dihydroorotate dehydrogenase n=1 Tax=Actinotalea lenta TaxID=3064654 RepID=UPI0027130BCB|nr:quinone-dependent dihydroorotate dehydrogenase [Isoptericola sp. b490]MDO8120355.1 quinone-dependent dihydroorotate dehydrogenase [Isoptericola sp. b490]